MNRRPVTVTLVLPTRKIPRTCSFSEPALGFAGLGLCFGGGSGVVGVVTGVVEAAGGDGAAGAAAGLVTVDASAMAPPADSAARANGTISRRRCMAGQVIGLSIVSPPARLQ